MRQKDATLNQAISDQKFRQLSLLHKDPLTLFTTIATHFHLSFLLPQTLCIYTTNSSILYTPTTTPPSFLPLTEIQSLHDTFLQLRDVHQPISISWLLLVKPFPPCLSSYFSLKNFTYLHHATCSFSCPRSQNDYNYSFGCTTIPAPPRLSGHPKTKWTEANHNHEAASPYLQQPRRLSSQRRHSRSHRPTTRSCTTSSEPRTCHTNWRCQSALRSRCSRCVPISPLSTLNTNATEGNLRSLNELAKQARADHIIHTGDFGFYDETSLDRIADK